MFNTKKYPMSDLSLDFPITHIDLQNNKSSHLLDRYTSQMQSDTLNNIIHNKNTYSPTNIDKERLNYQFNKEGDFITMIDIKEKTFSVDILKTRDYLSFKTKVANNLEIMSDFFNSLIKKSNLKDNNQKIHHSHRLILFLRNVFSEKNLYI